MRRVSPFGIIVLAETPEVISKFLSEGRTSLNLIPASQQQLTVLSAEVADPQGRPHDISLSQNLISTFKTHNIIPSDGIHL
jgi:hypothetical protein